MGSFEKDAGHLIYRQDDGDITAWFDHDEQKPILAHTGQPGYQKAFFILVFAGLAYLAFIFISI